MGDGELEGRHVREVRRWEVEEVERKVGSREEGGEGGVWEEGGVGNGVRKVMKEGGKEGVPQQQNDHGSFQKQVYGSACMQIDPQCLEHCSNITSC